MSRTSTTTVCLPSTEFPLASVQTMPSQLSNGTSAACHASADPVRYIPLSYDGSNPDASAREIVLSLRPDWALPDANLEFTRFTDGITNTLLKASNKNPTLSKEQVDNEAILLRAYGNGTDVLIDRHREKQNHEQLMKSDLAPELLACFENGIAYRFMSGRVTSPADLRTRPIYLAVARRLAQWHSTVPCQYDVRVQKNGINGAAGHPQDESAANKVAPGKPYPNLWSVLQKWILALPSDTETQKARQVDLQKELVKLIDKLSKRPGLGEHGLVFAHCDLLSGNVIVQPQTTATAPANGSPAQESVHFIDYEYATPSPAAFDIANHFAEWGGFDCDYSALPSRTQRREFIQAYIDTFYDMKGSGASNGNGAHIANGVDREAEVQALLEEVDVYRGVPGFYWGIWALIQATISQIDFDYADYAEVRLGEYWAWRDEMSGARAAEGRDPPLREKRWAEE